MRCNGCSTRKDTGLALGEQLAGQDMAIGYEDDLVGRLAGPDGGNRQGAHSGGQPQSGALVGLVARRDLLRVRANMIRHEREREKLIRILPR
jgi:CIC family chloride channel protein